MSITNEACLAHLQGMVRIPTVSNPDSRLMDFSKFDELHDFLRTSYPLFTSICRCKKWDVQGSCTTGRVPAAPKKSLYCSWHIRTWYR